jgi:hypothetical protein
MFTTAPPPSPGPGRSRSFRNISSKNAPFGEWCVLIFHAMLNPLKDANRSLNTQEHENYDISRAREKTRPSLQASTIYHPLALLLPIALARRVCVLRRVNARQSIYNPNPVACRYVYFDAGTNSNPGYLHTDRHSTFNATGGVLRTRWPSHRGSVVARWQRTGLQR